MNNELNYGLTPFLRKEREAGHVLLCVLVSLCGKDGERAERQWQPQNTRNTRKWGKGWCSRISVFYFQLSVFRFERKPAIDGVNP